MVILIDADDVLENMTESWINRINEKYGTSVKLADSREWDLSKAFPSLTREQVYGTEGDEEIYASLKPIEGAVEYTKRLISDGHELYIVTNTPYFAYAYKMKYALLRYYPHIGEKRVIVTANKKMVKGDVLIDDGVHNLIGGDYRKILVSAPYNEDFDAESNGVIRVKSWKDIYDVICGMQQEENNGM